LYLKGQDPCTSSTTQTNPSTIEADQSDTSLNCNYADTGSKSPQLLHHPHDLRKAAFSEHIRKMQVLKTGGLKVNMREMQRGITTYLVDCGSVVHFL